jgi:hypothetical protein
MIRHKPSVPALCQRQIFDLLVKYWQHRPDHQHHEYQEDRQAGVGRTRALQRHFWPAFALSSFGGGAFAIFFSFASKASSESSVSSSRAASLNLSICDNGFPDSFRRFSVVSLIVLPNPPLRHDYSSFTDETGMSESYMITGGVSCASEFAQEIHETVLRIGESMPFDGSIQWKHLSVPRLPYYKRLIDTFLEWNSEHLVDFHAVVVERARLRNKEFNNGDAEIAFNKFLYQSMYSSYRRYPNAEVLRCFHGNRESPYDFVDLRKMLNNTVTGAEWGRVGPFREVKHMNVNSTGPLQLADLLLGAMGSFWNRKKPISNPAKIELARYFQCECAADCLTKRTPPQKSHFDIWEFKLR